MKTIKTENRQRHKWGDPDEYGIYTCLVCGKLMRKKANTTLKRWMQLYSVKGIRWTEEHLDCKKKQEMKTDNELIAEFMGMHSKYFQVYSNQLEEVIWFREGEDFPSCYFRIIELMYHSSWDWLMPVIDKIRSIGYRVNIDFGKITQCAISNIDPMMHVVELSVYKTVVEFIKWYNIHGK